MASEPQRESDLTVYGTPVGDTPVKETITGKVCCKALREQAVHFGKGSGNHVFFYVLTDRINNVFHIVKSGADEGAFSCGWSVLLEA